MKLTALDYLFQYLETIITWRITNPKSNFKNAPDLDSSTIKNSPLGDFIIDNQCSKEEIVILLCALQPHIAPLLLKDTLYKHRATTLISLSYNHENLVYPTLKFIKHLIGGHNILAQLNVDNYFLETHLFHKAQLIKRVPLDNHQHLSEDIPQLYQDTLNRIVNGRDVLPKPSKTFPAEHIKTQRQWADLILPKNTLQAIQSIQTWYTSNTILMNDWGMKHILKPGYRVLFYGESGTGKTLAATLLGKYTGRPVFRIDVSMLVSKYIGETEKHLANLFNKAEDKNWILFFDEADAIFGKRTNVKDAHDKYANQEVSYLLQRIETFPGLVILASNFKNNIDKAFTRRFHQNIKFNKPQYAERLRIWQHNLPKQLNADEIDFEHLAKRYELTGANIINIIQDVSLKIIASGDPNHTLTKDILLSCIKREYDKEDKIF